MRKTIPASVALLLLASSAAFAQTTAPTTGPATAAPHTTTAPSATTPSTSLPGGTIASMTDAQAKAWVGKNLYTSDNKHVGDVVAIKRDSTGKVTDMEADVGGFLGLGTSRVKLNPSQISLAGDRVNVQMTSDEVKNLPKVAK